MSQLHPELCGTHHIRLQQDGASNNLICPVCAQLSNQEMLRRRSRRR